MVNSDRSTQRLDDVSRGKGAGAFQGESEDWRHLDAYWRDMYAEPYPGRSPYPARSPEPPAAAEQMESGPRRSASEAASGPKPIVFRRPDERIRDDIRKAFRRHPYIDADAIEAAVEVFVQDGEVTLSGEIDNRNVMRMVVDCVWTVAGVRNVRNQIQVHAGDTGERHAA